MKARILFACFVALGLVYPVQAQEPESFGGNIILGRPTDRSITVNVLFTTDQDAVYLEYGDKPAELTNKTPLRENIKANAPYEEVIGSLEPNRRYYYRVRYKAPGEDTFGESAGHTFHTQRPPGSSFTFAVQADPHMDDNSDPEVYRLTLQNELAEKPDFLIDLGDIFMSDKLRPATYEEVLARHLLLRSYYDLVCHSAPLFLALGNHEGEWGGRLDGTPDNLPIWATKIRKQLYPNPFPDSFYTGSTKEEDYVGLRENYYAWEWGDALFVVLDPYWYTPSPPEASGEWSLTLGREQYDWLRRTLETSKATFKFVFCHNLVGGRDMDGKMRGGIEVAKYLEWGGYNLDDSWGFDRARPGWAMPIHQLLVANNATIFFHGHDHLYAKQDLDGIVYQETPQPSARNYELGNRATAYSYLNGTMLGNSGYLRLRVSPSEVKVDYIRTWLPKDENQERRNGEVAHSYTIQASQKRLVTVSAASYSETAAPESIVSSFGEMLSDNSGTASVTVRDSEGSQRTPEVLFASPTQVNFVVPPGTAPGVATVTISSGDGRVVTGDMFVQTVAPALFTANATGAGVAAATVLYVHGDGSRTFQLTFECSSVAGQCTPVPIDLDPPVDQAYLSLYGTGIRNHAGLSTIEARLGGEAAEVLYAGPQGLYTGLDQVNVRIPPALSGRGEVTVSLSVAGKNANAVTVSFR